MTATYTSRILPPIIKLHPIVKLSDNHFFDFCQTGGTYRESGKAGLADRSDCSTGICLPSRCAHAVARSATLSGDPVLPGFELDLSKIG